jgi:hypothetical protein
MAELTPAEAEARKQRNLRIAAHVGSFALPLAGIVGAVLFYARGETRTAYTVALCALAGVFFYVIVFGTG